MEADKLGGKSQSAQLIKKKGCTVYSGNFSKKLFF